MWAAASLGSRLRALLASVTAPWARVRELARFWADLARASS